MVSNDPNIQPKINTPKNDTVALNRFMASPPHNKLSEWFLVGNQMEYLFRWFVRFAGPKCTCHADQAEYNEWGPDKCLDEIETILDRLQANANQSDILKPIFIRSAAKRFVHLAINRARIGRPIPPKETWW